MTVPTPRSKEYYENPGTPIDPVLTLTQVSAAVTYSQSQIQRKVKAGTFPKPIRLGPGRVGWRQSVVAEWLDQLTECG